MAHAVFWPKKKFFYPVGNTPPVSFTASLNFETPASILLLGCGDPRSILYTLFLENNNHRLLDFTCCDAEPAILGEARHLFGLQTVNQEHYLARNVLLLTMIIDDEETQFNDRIWNIFFHFFLDKTSLCHVKEQCCKLLDLSVSIESWEKGKYSKFLRFCSTHTLNALRRQWTLYASIDDPLGDNQSHLRKAFITGMQLVRERFAGAQVLTAARSAGPLWAFVASAGAAHYQRFWETGLTFSDVDKISTATFVNPTFAYDSSGQEFNVHYGTDPLLAFHLGMVAKLPLSSRHVPSISELIQIAKQQFQDWSAAFIDRVRLESPNFLIRLFVGDALNFSRALHIFSTTDSTECGLYPSAWEASPIHLDGGGYSEPQQGRAPAKFNVIDTSNLADHIGLINILTVTIPLLQKHPVATLYTNTLLAPSHYGGRFVDRACADIATLSLILGVVPVAYVSGFMPQTNGHEVLAHGDVSPTRHETISWKIAPGDGVTETLQIAAESLGNILFSIYLKMFSDEDASNLFGLKTGSRLIHYTRGSWAAFLSIVKERTRCDWNKALDHLLSLIEKDKTLFTGLNYYQDLCSQLHIYGVGTVEAISNEEYGNFASRVFKDWERIPPVVCIVLNVPRKFLRGLEGTDADLLGTPIMHCELGNQQYHNAFCTIQCFFGRAVPDASDPYCLLAVEDPLRWRGTSPLVVSFYVPSWILTVQNMETQVKLSLRPGTSRTSKVYDVLGPQLCFFSAGLLDPNHVQIAYRRPGNPQELVKFRRPPAIKNSSPSQLISLIVDQGSVNASGLTGRLIIDNKALQIAFRACPLTEMTVVQMSPFNMRVSIGRTHSHAITFPYPIDGSHPMARIARKSSYIEVDVKLFTPDCNGLVKNPFPTVYQDSVLMSWNIHHVNLSKSPKLNMSYLHWLHSHLNLSLSDADRSSKRGLISNLKFAINEMFSVFRKGHQALLVFTDSARVFAGFWIFPDCIRLDLPSHTIIGEACVIPFTGKAAFAMWMTAIQRNVGTEVPSTSASIYELRTWWQLLPILAERCRDWPHSSTCKFRNSGILDNPDLNLTPLCGCSLGKSLPSSFLAGSFKDMAPFATRVAFMPFFPCSYVNSIATRKSLAEKTELNECDLCGKTGQPHVMRCAACSQAKYCSKDCQKKDWKAHRIRCKNPAERSASSTNRRPE